MVESGKIEGKIETSSTMTNCLLLTIFNLSKHKKSVKMSIGIVGMTIGITRTFIGMPKMIIGML
jgi:hypothetical protein